MKNLNLKNSLSIIIIVIGIFVSYSVVAQAQAQNIVYPIAELGNCENETACKAFCDDQNNISVCVAFAEGHNLISKDEAAKAKAFIKSGKVGPGGCKGKDQCEAFCNDTANIDVCLNFAKNNGLMNENELKEAEKFSKALKEGAQAPGSCKNKNECENYCNNPDHMEECIAFAEKADLIPRGELEEAKKALKAIKSGVNPPGNCRGKKECETYCSESSHMEECLAFAEKAGFIPPEEAIQARKMIPLMQAGKMPGGCRGKNECETYCADESHSNECANFAIEAGLMKPEEAEMFKKTGGKGPGNCKGKDQCEAFCNDSNNQEVCFNFAKEHNLIPAEEVEKMKSGMEQMKKGFEMAPPEVSQCLKSAVGEDVLNKVQSGQTMPSQQLGEQMRKCFEQFMPKMPQAPQGGPQGEGIPGGQNGQMPPAGMMPPQGIRGMQGIPEGAGFGGSNFGGPGGCKSPEECQKYCSEHLDECSKIQGGFQGGDQTPNNKIREGIPETIKQIEGMPNSGIPGSGIPGKEQIEKMMQGGKIPEGFPKNFDGQNIPEQYKNMIPMMPQAPQLIPAQ
ncbi:hypothetical protein HZC33_00915 [Candidatus Wolfebacteria bacterium]|nr:hypothetical protein [Candidatus Wolfebacteria bacterium]